MTIRASGGGSHLPASQGTATVWVLSPHLLVAQAVAAALRSVGEEVMTAAWEAVCGEQDPAATSRLAGGHVVVIMDEFDVAYVEQVSRLVGAGPNRVMVVTSGASAFWWGALLVSDAVEVVSMAGSVDQLAQLVGRFVRGDPLTGAEERQELRAAWADAMDSRRRAANLVATLSPQQRRVLELLATGRRVNEVGVLIGVTSGTVRSHVKALRAKLGARTQLEAVAMLRQLHELGEPPVLVPRPRVTPVDAEVAQARR